MRVEFFKEYFEIPAKTRKIAEEMEAKGTPELAKPHFDEVDMVTIRAPGDRNTSFYGVATKEIKAEYPREWDMYQKGETGKLNGYPLKEWAPISAPQCRHLNTAGIFTVEDLANVNDVNLPSLGPSATRLREQATKWLAEYKKEQPLLAVVEENAQLKQEMAAMRNQLDQIAAAQANAPAPVPAAVPAPVPAADPGTRDGL